MSFTQSVALFVADAVARLLVALVDGALDLLALQVGRYGRFPGCLAADAAREVGVVHFTLLAVPGGGAIAVESAQSILNPNQ